MNSILVLCEGNICRSPMAQGILHAALPGATVRSAGIGALVGMKADPIAIRLMQERGINIDSHRAVQMNGQLALGADLVLVMDSAQKLQVEAMYPLCRGRIHRIGKFTDQDIPDPFRSGEQAFRFALSLIERGIAEWLVRLHKI